MPAFSFRRASSRILTLAVLPLAVGCSSSPSQFYLLSSSATPPPGHAMLKPADAEIGVGSSRPGNGSRRTAASLVGVAVTIPEYLNRLDIVERVSANEAKPTSAGQWGEDLSVSATRAVAEDLTTLLPLQDVIMMPTRIARPLDYQVNLDLMKFDSDSEGNSILTGRWSITDAAGVERASGRASYSERATASGYQAMAATMSRNLGAVSRDIAAALNKLPPSAAAAAASPRKNAPHRSKSGIAASHASVPPVVAGASAH